MSKRRGATVENVRKWLKRGDGQGEGRNYRPFLHVRDVPSDGRSAIVLGLKTQRIHHYLSDIEYHHHILAEFSPDVIDIRDQYALLPWEETQEIARELGIRHSVYRYTNTPVVMTSDIVMTLRNHDLAVASVKYSSAVKFLDPDQEIAPEQMTPEEVRTLEKLCIEREYWVRRGAKWKVSTEKDICVEQAANLDTLRTHMVSAELDGFMPYIHKFVDIFQKRWCSHVILNDLVAETGKVLGLSQEIAFCLFGRAVWLRLLPVNLGTPIDHFLPVNLNTSFNQYTPMGLIRGLI